MGLDFFKHIDAESDLLYKIFDSSPALMTIRTFPDNVYLEVNQAFLDTLGYTKEEVIGKSIEEIGIINDQSQLQAMQETMALEHGIKSLEVQLRKKTGEIIDTIIDSERIEYKKSHVFITVIKDVTELKRSETLAIQRERMLLAVAEATAELINNHDFYQAVENGIAKIGLAAGVDRVYLFENNYDQTGHLVSVSQKKEWASAEAEPQIDNPALQDLSYSEILPVYESLVRQEAYETTTKDISDSVFKNHLNEQQIYSLLIFPVFADYLFWGFVGFDNCQAEKSWTDSEKALLSSFVASVEGSLSRKMFEEKIQFLSFHDQLTGLYNRRFYETELQRLDQERNLPLALIVGDLNGLKFTNDVFGHQVGDKLLVKAAEIIREACRADDIISRIGGDEFVILLPKTSHKEAAVIVGRMQALIAGCCVDQIDLSVSFGWSVKETPEQSVDEVFKEAEDYMYKRKIFESANMRNKTFDLLISKFHERNKSERDHSRRVSLLSRAMGEALGLTEKENNKLEKLGLLHDIGKVALEDHLLKKETLTKAEQYEIRRHAEIGYQMLQSVGEMSEYAAYNLSHHERWDGQGYPKGLKGEQIPFYSRIISIAEAFDYMTHPREYKKALSQKEAVTELLDHAGTQFDPQLVDVFVRKVLKKHVEQPGK